MRRQLGSSAIGEEIALDSITKSDRDNASAVLHHGAGRNRRALQRHVGVRRRMHHSDGCDFPYHPLASGTNGAQVEEDSARPDRLALPARAAYARAPFLVCGDRACLHRYSGFPDPGKPHRKFSGNHGRAGGRREAGGSFRLPLRRRLRQPTNPASEAGSPSMLELMLCSMLTLLPDFLFRRFVQGKRLGKEITLVLGLVRASLGHHALPDPDRAADHGGALQSSVLDQRQPALFRTISIFAETGGRVSEVYVGYNQKVKKGDPLFKMDSKRQEAALETARASRCRGGGGDGHGQGRRPDQRGQARRSQGIPGAGAGRTANQAETAGAQSGRCRDARAREAANAGGDTARQRRRGGGHQAVGRNAAFDGPAGAEGERGSASLRQPRSNWTR